MRSESHLLRRVSWTGLSHRTSSTNVSTGQELRECHSYAKKHNCETWGVRLRTQDVHYGMKPWVPSQVLGPFKGIYRTSQMGQQDKTLAAQAR